VNLPNPIDYPDNEAAFGRWLRRWQHFFVFRENGSEPKARQVPEEALRLFAPIVRTTLNRLWAEHDARQRDWYYYRLRDAHRLMIRHLEGWDEAAIWGDGDTIKRLLDYSLQEVPALSPFEATLYWAQTNQRLMLYCASPTCAAPYFFRSEKGQKFCSPECADPARREAKLRWWNKSPNSPKNRGNKK
jgi:hypothetical protein